jgi:hypothetical protein
MTKEGENTGAHHCCICGHIAKEWKGVVGIQVRRDGPGGMEIKVEQDWEWVDRGQGGGETGRRGLPASREGQGGAGRGRERAGWQKGVNLTLGPFGVFHSATLLTVVSRGSGGILFDGSATIIVVAVSALSSMTRMTLTVFATPIPLRLCCCQAHLSWMLLPSLSQSSSPMCASPANAYVDLQGHWFRSSAIVVPVVGAIGSGGSDDSWDLCHLRLLCHRRHGDGV